LQSQGELTIASTGKDPQTGKLVTQSYRVEGPVMLFLTTTAIDLDEELKSRCLTLAVNESRDQTRAIQARQRFAETLDGLLAAQARDDMLRLHRNAQRLLRPLKIVNPYAERLTFLDDKTRMRRDHQKYLMLIRAIALLHQHQRPVKTASHGEKVIEYVEVTLDDIALANRLAHEVLGRTLDELPPQTRRLLSLLHAMVTDRSKALSMHRSDYRFSRRDARESAGWSDTQLKVHLSRLVELEYLAVYRDGHRQRYRYELLYDGEGADGEAFVLGLIDVEALESSLPCDYDANRSGSEAVRSGSGRPVVGVRSGDGPHPETGANVAETTRYSDNDETRQKRTSKAPSGNGASYSQEPVTV